MQQINIANRQKSISISKSRFRQIVQEVIKGEAVANYDISIAFVDNPTIHQLNKQYLNHDEPTDVLSFPLSDPGDKKLEGELIIGAEVAHVEAEDRGHDVQSELALYVIHGLLHLCGEDDKTPESALRMREKERSYLLSLGMPDVSDGQGRSLTPQ